MAKAKWSLSLTGTGFVLLALAGGCIYDDSDPCGPNQVFQEAGLQCVCAPGHGLVAGECVPCGAGETGNPVGECVCSDGLIRSDSGACVDPSEATCTQNADCGEAANAFCRLEGDTGYCTTSGCTPGAGECEGLSACNDRDGVPFCERPPAGMGDTCSGPSDCGQAATFCDVIESNVCLVQGCAADPAVCHGDWVCCDIALIGTSLCIGPAELDNGACPAGGTLIPREGR